MAGGGGVSWVAAVFFNKFMHRDGIVLSLLGVTIQGN